MRSRTANTGPLCTCKTSTAGQLGCLIHRPARVQPDTPITITKEEFEAVRGW